MADRRRSAATATVGAAGVGGAAALRHEALVRSYRERSTDSGNPEHWKPQVKRPRILAETRLLKHKPGRRLYAGAAGLSLVAVPTLASGVHGLIHGDPRKVVKREDRRPFWQEGVLGAKDAVVDRTHTVTEHAPRKLVAGNYLAGVGVGSATTGLTHLALRKKKIPGHAKSALAAVAGGTVGAAALPLQSRLTNRYTKGKYVVTPTGVRRSKEKAKRPTSQASVYDARSMSPAQFRSQTVGKARRWPGPKPFKPVDTGLFEGTASEDIVRMQASAAKQAKARARAAEMRRKAMEGEVGKALRVKIVDVTPPARVDVKGKLGSRLRSRYSGIGGLGGGGGYGTTTPGDVASAYVHRGFKTSSGAPRTLRRKEFDAAVVETRRQRGPTLHERWVEAGNQRISKMSPRDIPAKAGAHWTVRAVKAAERLEAPIVVIDRKGRLVATGRTKAARSLRKIAHDTAALPTMLSRQAAHAHPLFGKALALRSEGSGLVLSSNIIREARNFRTSKGGRRKLREAERAGIGQFVREHNEQHWANPFGARSFGKREGDPGARLGRGERRARVAASGIPIPVVGDIMQARTAARLAPTGRRTRTAASNFAGGQIGQATGTAAGVGAALGAARLSPGFNRGAQDLSDKIDEGKAKVRSKVGLGEGGGESLFRRGVNHARTPSQVRRVVHAAEHSGVGRAIARNPKVAAVGGLAGGMIGGMTGQNVAYGRAMTRDDRLRAQRHHDAGVVKALAVVDRPGPKPVPLSRPEQDRLRRRKERSAALSVVGGTTGLSALGATLGAAALKPKTLRRVGITPQAWMKPARKKLHKVTVPLVTVGAGLGGINSFNYASIQHKEAGQVRKAWTRPQKVVAGLGVAGAGTLGFAATPTGQNYHRRARAQNLLSRSGNPTYAGYDRAGKKKMAQDLVDAIDARREVGKAFGIRRPAMRRGYLRAVRVPSTGATRISTVRGGLA